MRPAGGPVELFGGISAGGPYQDESVLLRANFDIGPHLALGTNVRIPQDVGDEFGPDFTETGASVSLTYKLLRE